MHQRRLPRRSRQETARALSFPCRGLPWRILGHSPCVFVTGEAHFLPPRSAFPCSLLTAPPPHRPTGPPAHRSTGSPRHRPAAPRGPAAPRPIRPAAHALPPVPPHPPPPQVPVRYLIYQGRILVRYGCTIVPYTVSGMQTPPGPIASGPPQGLTATGTTRFRRTLRYSRFSGSARTCITLFLGFRTSRLRGSPPFQASRLRGFQSFPPMQAGEHSSGKRPRNPIAAPTAARVSEKGK